MIEVNNLTAVRLEEDFLKTIAKKVLTGENEKSLTLSIALVGRTEIKELNRKYRGKNKATDVLSFRYDDSGEVVICLAEVRKNAGDSASTFKRELCKVLIHGILHLSGYDHEKSQRDAEKMEEKQNHFLEICQRLI